MLRHSEPYGSPRPKNPSPKLSQSRWRPVACTRSCHEGRPKLGVPYAPQMVGCHAFDRDLVILGDSPCDECANFFFGKRGTVLLGLPEWTSQFVCTPRITITTLSGPVYSSVNNGTHENDPTPRFPSSALRIQILHHNPYMTSRNRLIPIVSILFSIIKLYSKWKLEI